MSESQNKPAGPDLIAGVALTDLADGGTLGGRVGDEEVVLVRRGTEVFAVGAHCTLRSCIVGPGAVIGDHCVVDGMSVIGQDVILGADNVVSRGARIFPGVKLGDGALRF